MDQVLKSLEADCDQSWIMAQVLFRLVLLLNFVIYLLCLCLVAAMLLCVGWL